MREPLAWSITHWGWWTLQSHRPCRRSIVQRPLTTHITDAQYRTDSASSWMVTCAVCVRVSESGNPWLARSNIGWPHASDWQGNLGTESCGRNSKKATCSARQQRRGERRRLQQTKKITVLRGLCFFAAGWVRKENRKRNRWTTKASRLTRRLWSVQIIIFSEQTRLR